MKYEYEIENGNIRYYTTGPYYEFVYHLDGIPYDKFNTDPRALLIYQGIDKKMTMMEGSPVGNGRITGVAISTDVWDIILQVTEQVGVLERQNEIYRRIHEKYPDTQRIYTASAMQGILGGLGKDFYIRRPEKVMLMKESV